MTSSGSVSTELTQHPEYPLYKTEHAINHDLPDLEYTLHTRKWYIGIFWFLVLLDSVAMPLALYYGLFYGTHLSHNAVFSISTGALGGASIFEYFLRFWRLWRKDSTCRVIGGRRSYLDWFHWNYSFAWFIVMLELIIGTIPREPPIRLLSMPPATMLFTFAVELLTVEALRHFEIPSPCRISSIPKGSPLRPAIYPFIEDVVAVDGSGGTTYRERLNTRYEASVMFRQMLIQLTWFWAGGAASIASATTIVIFTVPGPVAYGVGWTVPFIWAGIWTLITVKWVQVSLRREKENWYGTKDKT